jgi:hypothetical protein
MNLYDLYQTVLHVLSNPFSCRLNEVPCLLFATFLTYWLMFIPLYIIEKAIRLSSPRIPRLSHVLMIIPRAGLKLQQLFYHVGFLTGYGILVLRGNVLSACLLTPLYVMFLKLEQRTFWMLCAGLPLIAIILHKGFGVPL